MSDPFVLLHGLSYNHRQFAPLIHELTALAPDRRIQALDLPGHGDAAPRDNYRLAAVAAAVHEQVPPGTTPVLIGHSVGAVIATAYAARYRVRAVLNLDQPLLTGPFGAAVRAAEPVLRSPRWPRVWDGFVAAMGVDELPTAARNLVETATDPRQELLLGYWAEILESTDDELTAARETELRALRDSGVAYHWVTGSEPAAAYRTWLTAALPTAQVTVLPGGHFPHLAHPKEVAHIAAALGGSDTSMPPVGDSTDTALLNIGATPASTTNSPSRIPPTDTPEAKAAEHGYATTFWDPHSGQWKPSR